MLQPTVYALFSIPIYVVDCDEDVQQAVDFLNKDHDLIPNDQSSAYGNKSVDDYILHNAECNQLKQFILTHVEKFAREIMAWEFKNFQITQSWLTIKSPNESHGIHFHPNSVLSGVFFFQETNEAFEKLTFHRPAFMSQVMNQFAPTTSTEQMKHTEFPWHEWHAEPKKNRLVLFPSWLSHSVGTNKTNILRKSLAFNAIPTGKFGDRINATELDITRLV
jgi:uncharacterized protein (TIGR02466 family)